MEHGASTAIANFGFSAPTSIERAAMQRAFELATNGPTNTPNPQVGCVLLTAGGSFLAEGWHRGAGSPHAEAAAINNAQANGINLHGATAVVTLEPCAHQGRTPSCAKALISAGVTRVLFAVPDPTPAAQGGAQLLRSANVTVLGGISYPQGQDLLAHWLATLDGSAQTAAVDNCAADNSGTAPWIVAKWAMTLDGRIAAADGSSQWITGAQAREHAHTMRAQTQALLIGTGTLLADDPQLTARPKVSQYGRQPLKVVVGLREIPANARVYSEQAQVLHLTTHSPAAVVEELRRNGISHAIIDGGPTLNSAFLAAGLVDEIHAYIAPKFLGAGAPAIANLGITTLTDSLEFQVTRITTLGSDILITLNRERTAARSKTL